jgi:transcriptional regulator with XRE-family HTH domain
LGGLIHLPSIEKGERNVSIEILEKLSRALNIDIVEFFKK